MTVAKVSVVSNKVVIGITGSIGAGKSVVSRILRLWDLDVYDCDYAAKEIMNFDSGLRAELIDLLGAEAYNDRGLCREYVAGKIFGDSRLREAMNAKVHHMVMVDFEKFAETCNGKLVFCESAILGSSGFSCFCDSIWMVTAPSEVTIPRVMKRNGLTTEQIMSRLKTQENETEHLPPQKIKTIENWGDTGLLNKIKELLETELRALSCNV